ncbi:glycosyltransferase [Egbenema bharatensis]|uniref:glycosyltransferase n=1 Tax=Egbenema bharatensis TaxID=3463334 RepID=UPI003A8BCFAD
METLLPSFSIVLETENLATADVRGLARSLDSLAAQEPKPTAANEVWLIESGDIPPDLLQQLCDCYPWIKVHHAPPETTYYQAKMLGASLSTGAIVVYYDSDCLYSPDWLQTILTCFQDESIQTVAGETTTGGQGAYGTAMALAYIFPQFSQRTQPTPTNQYFLNNVAFRRTFLLQHPIPTDLPLYRGNCVVHAHQLTTQGYTIWQHPKAKVVHAPPNGLSHFFWRFLLIGHDYYWQKRLIGGEGVGERREERGERREERGVGREERGVGRQESGARSGEAQKESLEADPTPTGVRSKLGVFGDRLSKLRQNHPGFWLDLPFALPIAFVAALLIYAGYLITSLRPKSLLSIYSAE